MVHHIGLQILSLENLSLDFIINNNKLLIFYNSIIK